MAHTRSAHASIGNRYGLATQSPDGRANGWLRNVGSRCIILTHIQSNVGQCCFIQGEYVTSFDLQINTSDSAQMDDFEFK
jgi:hypothetical protein